MNHLGHEGLGTGFSTLAALTSPLHQQLTREPLYRGVAPLEVRNWVWRSLAAVATTLRGWQRRRGERIKLAELDDHLLRDIGLTRAEVRAEVGKPFWRA